MTINQANNKGQLVNITGGTFKGNDPQLGDDSNGARFVEAGYVAMPAEGTTAGENGTYTVVPGGVITFVNYDGTELLSDRLAKDAMPEYTGMAPTKTATAEFTYTFAGWTPEVVAVTGDAIYTATFTAAKNSYTIMWKNDDDSVIDTTTVAYGEVPTHADATKAATAEYTYTFAGWTPEVVAVTGEATYTAQFTSIPTGRVITEYYLKLQSQISITLGVCDLLTDNVTSLAENGYYITYQHEGQSPNTVYFSDLTKDGYGYYDIVIGTFAAKQMTEDITVNIYNGDGTSVFTEVYSIQKYCKLVIEGNYGDKLTNLCKAVLDYGAYSQKYFGYNLNDLANEGTDYYSLSEIGSSYAGLDGSLKGVSILKQLNLESQVELWFEIDKDIAGSDLTVAVSAANNGFIGWSYTISDPIQDQYGEYVMVKIKGIPSGKLNERFNLTLTNSNGTSTWSWSAMSFAYAAQNSPSLGNVSRALGTYYEYASKYFTN